MAASAEGAALLQAAKTLRVGDPAPDFTADSSQGELHFHKHIDGKWAILFSHPADFTPVCTTELGAVGKLRAEWEKRNTAVIALSVDNSEQHKKWIADIEDITGASIYYPIIADADRKVSVLYGMLDQNYIVGGMPSTVRAVFWIDPAKVVRAILVYPASTGRNFAEIIRVLDSLQLAGSHKVATPADWQKGGQCMVLPTVSTEDAHKLFPKGVQVVRPWMRTTPDPLNS